MNTLIDILLPTYNGASYLEEMSESLFAQSEPRWRLLSRDDGSDDSTPAALCRLASRDPRVERALDEHIGIVRGMDALLHLSSGPYFMPADQDDVWHKEKIAALLTTMLELEARFGKETPLLVYCDAELVDAELRPLGMTFRQLHGFPDDWAASLRHVLVMSPVPGCTMLGNAALRVATLPLPDEKDIFMHDWWLLLCAFALGHVRRVARPLVRYRQHGGNLLGAKREFSLLAVRERIMASRADVTRTRRQAICLLRRHESRMREQDIRVCKVWANEYSAAWPTRVAQAFSLGFSKPGLLRNLLFYAVL